MIKEETDITKECLSILKTTTEEYEISDCINRASTSSMQHM